MTEVTALTFGMVQRWNNAQQDQKFTPKDSESQQIYYCEKQSNKSFFVSLNIIKPVNMCIKSPLSLIHI